MLHVFIRSSELRFAAGQRLISQTESGRYPRRENHYWRALFRPRGKNANAAYRPLSEQSIAILKQIKDITGNND